MAVYRGPDGRWRYRARVRLPDGRCERVSGSAPKQFNSKEAAKQAERDHIHRVRNPSVDASRKEVPSLDKFHRMFLESYVRANNKPSERMAKEAWFKHHLIPAFGRKRIDEISTHDVENLKAKKPADGLKPKSVNNMLTVLGKTLRYAAECEMIEKLPRIKFVKVLAPQIDFLDYTEADRLIDASKTDAEGRAAILLGLDAGLRAGEIRALQWGDLDLVAGRVIVQRTDYRGHLGSPKGGRSRTVPLTSRLVAALKAIRSLCGPWVLGSMSEREGEGWVRWSRGEQDTFMRRAQARAKLRKIGWHTLRHTFCSHLAMRGAPVRTIQELAGHASLTTTQRYMHLTPSAKEQAIALLETPAGQTVAKGDQEGAVSSVR